MSDTTEPKKKSKAKKSKPKTQSKAHPAVGKLSVFGIKEPWQVALMPPLKWDDLRSPIFNFYQFFAPENEIVLVHGWVQSVSTGFTRSKGTPKLDGVLRDDRNNLLKFSMFGDGRELQKELEEAHGKVFLLGKVSHFRGEISIKDIELVEEKWVGKLRPVYKGKPRVITPETVRKKVIPLLRENIPVASQEIVNNLKESKERILSFAGVDLNEFPTLEHLISRVHVPRTVEQGRSAIKGLTLVSGWLAIKEAKLLHEKILKDSGAPSIPKPVGDGEKWISQIPFEFSNCQMRSAKEIISDLQSTTKPMRRILIGDVGYGKTAVFASAAATAYEASARVAVLMPNEALAEQGAREIKELWPELAHDVLLYTGNYNQDKDPRDFPLLVGTTALLFKDVGKIDFLIVDEQQKFSREQREQLLSEGTHLLEATATCIPRSQALTMFGGMQTSILDEPPKERYIETVIRKHQDREQMMRDAVQTIKDGFQVLIVYPKKEKTDDDEVSIRDVESAYKAWDKIMPGQARLAHSDRSESENEEAIRDMREGKAKILISTTVVEVGVNIPGLRRTIIVHPERFGLSTLHQIRGRTARTGGKGYCDLYCPEPIAPHSTERLNILTSSQNGFEIALKDLRLRGCGSLSNDSSKQTGSDDTILFGVPLTPDILEAAIDIERNIENENNGNY